MSTPTPDRTPGQVAFEDYFRRRSVFGTWADAKQHERDDHERMAAAVIAHHTAQQVAAQEWSVLNVHGERTYMTEAQARRAQDTWAPGARAQHRTPAGPWEDA